MTQRKNRRNNAWTYSGVFAYVRNAETRLRESVPVSIYWDFCGRFEFPPEG